MEITMKKMFTYGVLLMGMCLFTACTGDDDDEDRSVNRVTLSSPFAGYWKIKLDQGTTNLFFYDDGKLLYNGNEYVWKYDKSTGVMSTTVNDYQWEVTLTDSMAWTGIALWGDKSSVTNYRAAAEETAELILTSRDWVCNDTTWRFAYDGGNHFTLKYKSGDTENNIYTRDGFTISSVKESLVNGRINLKSDYRNYDYSGHWTGQSEILATAYGVCDIRIDNPYSYNEVRVRCHLTYRYETETEVRSDTSKDMILRPKSRK